MESIETNNTILQHVFKSFKRQRLEKWRHCCELGPGTGFHPRSWPPACSKASRRGSRNVACLRLPSYCKSIWMLWAILFALKGHAIKQENAFQAYLPSVTSLNTEHKTKLRKRSEADAERASLVQCRVLTWLHYIRIYGWSGTAHKPLKRWRRDFWTE